MLRTMWLHHLHSVGRRLSRSVSLQGPKGLKAGVSNARSFGASKDSSSALVTASEIQEAQGINGVRAL